MLVSIAEASSAIVVSLVTVYKVLTFVVNVSLQEPVTANNLDTER